MPFLWNCAKHSTTVSPIPPSRNVWLADEAVKRKHVRQNKEIIMWVWGCSGLSARLMMLQGQRTVQIGDENVE